MSSTETKPPVRLNLGSGQNKIPGYINVDRFGDPDMHWDLEQFPWPWEDNTVDEIVMNHVLEHIGESIPTFFGIIKELYRVCKPDARINIVVPHPRHDDFLGDPTHVRAFAPASFTLYDKAQNKIWAEAKAANSPLGLYLDVDLVIEKMQMDLEEPYGSQLQNKQITPEQINANARALNNVIKQIRVTWRVNKPDAK